jgi:DNA-directed RNA polymerase subunit alpha
MIKINCVESYIDSDLSHYGCFIIEPFFSGQALTVANAIRRTLLGDIVGTAITAVRLNNIKHEFSAIAGVREDVLEIMLNLKQVIFKSSKLEPVRAYLKSNGPSIVTASQFVFPNHLKLMNPNQYIATVFESASLEMEIMIEQGKGYKLYDEKRNSSDSDFLIIEGNFSPIRKVNFKIKTNSSDKYNVKESLILEIWTNGSISPKRSLKESTKFLIQLLYPLLQFENGKTVKE